MTPTSERSHNRPELEELCLVLRDDYSMHGQLLSELGILIRLSDLVYVDRDAALDALVDLFDNLIYKLGLADQFRLRY